MRLCNASGRLADAARRQHGRGAGPRHTRAAVQVAVAGGFAVLLGVLVSPERWYWAVVGAFVVFANTTSRGATIRKAGERTVGTFVGVVAGLVVSTVLPGPTVALSVGLVVLFGGL